MRQVDPLAAVSVPLGQTGVCNDEGFKRGEQTGTYSFASEVP